MHLENDDIDGLLPRSDLTAFTLLGNSVSERQTMGQLLATQVATAILTKSPEENRVLLLGLGLKHMHQDRQAFFGMIDLILDCL